MEWAVTLIKYVVMYIVQYVVMLSYHCTMYNVQCKLGVFCFRVLIMSKK
jgi:hypothetical protein